MNSRSASMGRVRGSAVGASTATLVRRARPARGSRSPWLSGVRTRPRAVELREVVLGPRSERTTAMGAEARAHVAATVSGAVLPVGVATTARSHEVARIVVRGVVVDVVGAERRPREFDVAPVARAGLAAELAPEHEARLGDLAVASRERVVRQVFRRPRTHIPILLGEGGRGRIFESGHGAKAIARTNRDRQGVLL